MLSYQFTRLVSNRELAQSHFWGKDSNQNWAFHFETIHKRKTLLLLVTALHSKSSAFLSFLMTFLDHSMLFDYFCNLFFFLPFLQVLFGSLHECYVSRELFWKEQLFVHLLLRTPSNNITRLKVARIYIFSIGNVSFVFLFCFRCFVRLFFFLLASRFQKKK